MSKQSLMDTFIMQVTFGGRTICYLKNFPELTTEGPTIENYKEISIQELQLIAEKLYDNLMRLRSRIDDVTPSPSQVKEEPWL